MIFDHFKRMYVTIQSMITRQMLDALHPIVKRGSSRTVLCFQRFQQLLAHKLEIMCTWHFSLILCVWSHTSWKNVILKCQVWKNAQEKDQWNVRMTSNLTPCCVEYANKRERMFGSYQDRLDCQIIHLLKFENLMTMENASHIYKAWKR